MKRIIPALAAALLTMLTLCAVLPIHADDAEAVADAVTETVAEVVDAVDAVTDGAAEEVRRQTVDEVASEIMAIAENASPEEIRYIRNMIADGVQYLDAHGLDRVAIMMTNHSETVALCALLVAICIYALWRVRSSKRMSAIIEKADENTRTVNDNLVESQQEFLDKMATLCENLKASDDRCDRLIAENRALCEKLEAMDAERIAAEEKNAYRLTASEAAAQGTLRLLAAMTTASDKLPPDLRDRLYTIAQTALKGGDSDEK